MAITTDELQNTIGDEEATSLKPANVKILEVNIEEVGDKKAKKVVFTCKHPDNAETIKISAIKWENKGKLEVSGSWYNLDSKKKIRKGSALSTLMLSLKANSLGDFVGKECPTIQDDKGYLCFKAY